MLTEKNNIDTLITLFLNHQISEQQLNNLQLWVDSNPENREYLAECQKVWLLTATQQRQNYNSELAYKRFTDKQTNAKTRKKQIISWQKIIPYAAIITLFILIGSLYHLYTQPAPQYIDYVVEVPNGSHTKLYMPDSSEVWINAGSKLEYSSGYGQQNRTVKLSGEAFFKITKNTDIPFIVQTDSVDIKVYGTSFNVRNFTNIAAIKVTLLEGSVALQLKSETTPVFLKPMEEMTYKKGTGNFTVTTVDNNFANWRWGKLHFDSEPFADIIHTLERQYNVTIQINNTQLLNKTFYGGFKTDQSIKEIIEIICAGMNINYSVTDNTYIIY